MNVAGWDWLVVAGGVLQAFGVGFLVFDIVRGFRRIEGYRGRPQTIYAPSAVAQARAFTPQVTGGEPPTVDERLDRLEAGLASVREDLGEMKERLRADARDAAEDAAHRVHQSAEDRFRAVEKALLGDTAWDRRRRLASVGFIVLGVILATLGGVAP